MTITLGELKTQARERADMEESCFVSDNQLRTFINNSIAELHDILIQAYDGDYRIIEGAETPTVSGQEDYTLPVDFYKIRGVDIKINNDKFQTIDKFNFNERNRFTDRAIWDLTGIPNVRYRTLGNNLRFSPAPDQQTTFRIWYIPLATKLVDDSDVFDDINAYSEYVVVDAAIKMFGKEESDTSDLKDTKAGLKRRIEEAANNRDAGDSPSVSDIHAENNDIFHGSGSF